MKELVEYRERVEALIDTCQRLSETDISVSASEFMAVTKIVQKLLGVQERAPVDFKMKPEEVGAKMVSIIDILEKRKIEVFPDPKVDFDIESAIEEVNENKLLLCSWSGHTVLECKLEYRMSEHGSSKANFDERCRGKNPTFVFIKSDHERVFGGFTTVEWMTPDTADYRLQDDNAYLFSITHKTKHPVYKHRTSAVRLWNEKYLFFFGGGCDLGIAEKCDKYKDSWTNFGFTYKPPEGIKPQSEEAMAYLAGAYCFKVKELEVYSVNFIL